MGDVRYKPASPQELEREPKDWELGVLTPKGWENAPEAIPRAKASTTISLRMPNEMMAVLKAFAKRNGIGYQVLLKRWLDDRIQEERDKIAMQQEQLTNSEWDIHGWKHLTVHDDPPLVTVRGEFLTWLEEVPEPHRTDLNHRLKSTLDAPHFSARLELFMHHYFATGAWSIQIHPDIPGTKNHPDFLVERQGSQCLVECRIVMDRQVVAQQEQRLRQLADELSGKLGTTVILEPLENLPPSLPAKRIRNEINHRIQENHEMLEIDVRGEHQGARYGIRAIVIFNEDKNELTAGVEGMMSQVQTITARNQVREALREKASKYGELQLPFVIAVSSEMNFPTWTKHELDALFGDRVWNIYPSDQVTETRKPNGLFSMTRDGDSRYARVSAVLFYRFKWLNNGHEHRMHVYHNPYATMPLDPGIFPDVPQFVWLDKEHMGWTNAEPDS